jgi:hypothetical protein
MTEPDVGVGIGRSSRAPAGRGHPWIDHHRGPLAAPPSQNTTKAPDAETGAFVVVRSLTPSRGP